MYCLSVHGLKKICDIIYSAKKAKSDTNCKIVMMLASFN